MTGQPTLPPQGVASGDEGLSVDGGGADRDALVPSPDVRARSLRACRARPDDRAAFLRFGRSAVAEAGNAGAAAVAIAALYLSRRFDNDGRRRKLAGTLTVPNAAATPLPGFVLVHGSGCNDRDETIGPNKIFAQLANRLSNDGYAVLRYDKRSCGKSGGKFPVRDRLIADARDAIAYLRAQPGIDPKRIYVLGHSEGGELAPSIAIADGHLRGIVLLAPPALPLEQILKQQLLRNVSSADRAATEKQVQARARYDRIGQEAGRNKPMAAKLVRSRSGGAYRARSVSDPDPSRDERHPSFAGRHAASRAGRAKRASRRNRRHAARRRSPLHKPSGGRVLNRRRILHALVPRSGALRGNRDLARKPLDAFIFCWRELAPLLRSHVQQSLGGGCRAN